MNKRVMAALMAASIMFSFAACDKAAKTSETTTEETTTVEETTTTEETTTEEETTTTEETTTSSVETTTVVEDVTESTTATTQAPTAKAKKSSAPSVPKGYKKLYWGKKFKGHMVYLAYKEAKGGIYYKGWWKNKWVDLAYDEAEPDYEGWSLAKKPYTLYYERGN